MNHWQDVLALLERGAVEDAHAALRLATAAGEAPDDHRQLDELTRCLELTRLWRDLAQQDLCRLLREQRSLSQALCFHPDTRA